MKITQDTRQRVQTTLLLMLEFYKVMMGTFLFTFVPQSCVSETSFDENKLCTVSEIINRTDLFSLFTHIINLFTFTQVLLFYYTEYKRENWCIKYLDICDELKNTNLDDEIEKYPTLKRNINTLNRTYMKLSINAIVWCTINTIISIISISRFYSGSTTLTSLLGFVVLVAMKMYSSYTNSSHSITDERVYSAYLTENKTFNTVDEDFKIPADVLDEIDTNNDDDTTEIDTNNDDDTSEINETDISFNIDSCDTDISNVITQRRRTESITEVPDEIKDTEI